MYLKKKICYTIVMLCLIVAIALVGVWAIDSTDFKVSGNISYTAPNGPVDAEDVAFLTFSYDDSTSTACVIGCENAVESVEIPSEVVYNEKTYTVTQIDGFAFGESEVTSIVIPDTVTSIGMYAFGFALTDLTIGSGVKTVGEGAFDYCEGLGNVNYTGTIKDWVEIEFDMYSMTPNPFAYTGNFKIKGEIVTSITAEDLEGVTSIGGHVFQGCSGLKEITIPASVTYIGLSAFYGCTGLTNVNYTGTLKDWVKIEFRGSDSNPMTLIKMLKINGEVVTKIQSEDLEGATSIGNLAFYNCVDIQSVEIPSGVVSIGNYAFQNCTGLLSVFIPDSVTSIGASAFKECSNLATVVIDSKSFTSGITAKKDAGYLLAYATKVYVKEGASMGSYLINTSNFTVGTSDKEGYVLYNKVV